ncbi:MAG: GNAT family N-acetyltransferase [Spirochaetaceae bacterium]|nr:GNAT family N-acetyltransferase [Spirochaetaceae bacterium]
MNIKPDMKPLGLEHLDEAVDLLVSAFLDRPFYAYLAPDRSERRAFLASNFRSRLEHSLHTSEIDLAFLGQKIAGIAVWVAPVDAPPPEDNSMEEMLADFSPGLKKRFTAFLDILITARSRVVTGPCWGLAPIAVLPEAQGTGIASVLMRKKLMEIDAASQPCFLGTQDTVNMEIYARYGFRKAREDPLSPDITHYSMIRPGG